MPPIEGETVPEFEALLCDGETFRSTALSAALGERGGVVIATGFAFSAIAQNWWKQFVRAGWDEFEDVAVLGISRDGPYAQNEFLRWLDEPGFRFFADVDGEVSESLELLADRDHMADVSTPWRSAFVLDADREVQYAFVADDWISPLPREEIEAAVAEL
ncbi:alkyl hydroperoxide reductase/ thiol specific antioxidant/ Mal allergen [Natrinema pellirubrum DSM 15624]|uniref:Alkyl hydroperoxide reductase/ thiol specific antioxidant/ Mal allergen n=1 Tax=Natrinema pellirubrum (strain DSM 15624 / CIP 106293 / JCM 10476 / NCIMB 786 / 157) TaxID=797303 RepID=L0JNZ0_NATP1|nr:redoxin domain-containing protein [Natrinema pellirubrum]AGB33250.1 Peroxiredoxin [Natrinema pellirubrum DSM 15624]ELY71614.1 alkyl hydroperoxide reductase/ thiol specific antioxidant/ Mal allergen [Natrinema pellirubrum DSM 15624]